MKSEFTAVIKEDGEWWVSWIEGVPGINCQEATRSELLETLRATLSESLGRDDFDLTIHDQDFAQQMAIAEQVMRDDREVLRRLADS